MPSVGPILHFRGQAGDRWRLAALLVRPGEAAPAPLLTEGQPPVRPRLLARRHGHGFWRYDFALPLRATAALGRYAIAGRAWPVHLPGRDGRRRLAYTACNGTEDETDGRVPPGRNALWRQLAAEHARDPFHLLLQGGDQLYADTLWEAIPELAAWRRLPWRRANRLPFPPALALAADAYYFERYCWLWNQPAIAPTLATVPSVMMWDDHDIFDGWGSWPAARQASPVFQGLGAVARLHFALFQLAARPDDLPDVFGDRQGRHFGCALSLGGIGLVAPDLRSERTRQRVMGEAGWRDFRAALAGLAGCRHLLVMSSVPLANTNLSPLERVWCALPGHSGIEDDLRDQWQSFAHRAEWRRVLRCLVAFAATSGARVTSLSGEIHLGALGLITGGAVRIHELIASGIVNPPPSALVVKAYDWLGRRVTRLEPDLTAGLLPLPGHGRRYLRQRNWLSLDLAGDGGFTAVWHTAAGPAVRLAVP